MMIVLQRDPDSILHEVMFARLADDELWDDADGLPLAAPVVLDAKDMRADAKRYKSAYGDFHKSWYDTRKRSVMHRHLFWASRHHAHERVGIIAETVREAFSRGIDAVLQKSAVTHAHFLAYSNQAMREWHRLLGFIRLSTPRPNMLYGEIQTDFHVVDAILIFLRKRYPGNTIAVKNGTHMHFSGAPERIDTVDIKGTPESEISRIFDVYYESQYIKERKNLRLLSHFVPKRYWEWISDGRKIARHAG